MLFYKSNHFQKYKRLKNQQKNHFFYFYKTEKTREKPKAISGERKKIPASFSGLSTASLKL